MSVFTIYVNPNEYAWAVSTVFIHLWSWGVPY